MIMTNLLHVEHFCSFEYLHSLHFLWYVFHQDNVYPYTELPMEINWHLLLFPSAKIKQIDIDLSKLSQNIKMRQIFGFKLLLLHKHQSEITGKRRAQNTKVLVVSQLVFA